MLERHTAGKSPEGKTNLDEPVQNHLAHLLLITQGQLLLGHEDAIAAVELEVCPPEKSERTGQVYHGEVLHAVLRPPPSHSPLSRGTWRSLLW